MNSEDFPVDRNDLLRLAADALAEDWASYGGPFEHLGVGAVDFRHQLALIREDSELLDFVLRGIGLYTHDEVREPQEDRPVWFPLSRDQENEKAARHELAIAQSALEESLKRHRDLIAAGADSGAGLEHAIQLERIRANPGLREKVLTALEFYRGTIKVAGQKRTVWFRWQPGDPPTAFTPELSKPG